jgi:transposase
MTKANRRITVSKVTYAGKVVSIGIDVHASSYYVTSVIEGLIDKRTTMRGEPEALVAYIKKQFKGAKVKTAYEAGFSGFELHRQLTAAGVTNIVVNAASIEVSSRDRVKTDKRDSEKIAMQLDKGNLEGIRIPTREQEASRVLHRTREQLVRKRSAVKAQIRMRFYQFGYRVAGPKEGLTFRKVAEALNHPLATEVKIGIRSLVSIWRALNSEIKVIEKEQKRQAEQDERTIIYRSIPGYGLQSACILTTELGDLSQFPNERKLFSFCGLTPTEESSGEHERKGHISRQGSGRLRCILVEAAWTAVRENTELRRGFERLARRVGKRRAIVAIARKLLGWSSPALVDRKFAW